METIFREFPANPNLVNYHTRRQLTRQMSERYKPNKHDYPENWIAALGEVTGLTQIHLLRHKLRLKKSPEMKWSTLTPVIEQKLSHLWENIQIKKAVNAREDRRRTYELPERFRIEKRQVFEGVLHSQSNLLAARLYKFPGITTLIFNNDELTVKRAYCYSWEELNSKICRVLESRTQP